MGGSLPLAVSGLATEVVGAVGAVDNLLTASMTIGTPA